MAAPKIATYAANPRQRLNWESTITELDGDGSASQSVAFASLSATQWATLPSVWEQHAAARGFVHCGFEGTCGRNTKSGGVTPRRAAQASRSESVVQQQLRQHCSALAQPQAPPWHGYSPLPLGDEEGIATIPTDDNTTAVRANSPGTLRIDRR